MNKKTKKVALCSALSEKAASGNVVVIDAITTAEYSTKTMVNMLTAVGAGKKALVALFDHDEKVIKSFANIPGVKTVPYHTINVYDVLNADTFVIAKAAAEKLEEVFA
jgi:large subunit ribosomal protein L4